MPSGYWQSQIIIYPTGDATLAIDDILDISDHPKCSETTESIGMESVGDRGEGRINHLFMQER